MRNLSTAKIRSEFSEIVNQVAYGKERVAVTRNGKSLIALVPIEDIALLEALETKIDISEAQAALKEAKTKGTKSWNKIKTENKL